MRLLKKHGSYTVEFPITEDLKLRGNFVWSFTCAPASEDFISIEAWYREAGYQAIAKGFLSAGGLYLVYHTGGLNRAVSTKRGDCSEDRLKGSVLTKVRTLTRRIQGVEFYYEPDQDLRRDLSFISTVIAQEIRFGLQWLKDKEPRDDRQVDEEAVDIGS